MKIEANVAFNLRNRETAEDYNFFDEQLYAWMNSFKVLLIRFENKALHWLMLLLIALSDLFICKISRKFKL